MNERRVCGREKELQGICKRKWKSRKRRRRREVYVCVCGRSRLSY